MQLDYYLLEYLFYCPDGLSLNRYYVAVTNYKLFCQGTLGYLFAACDTTTIIIIMLLFPALISLYITPVLSKSCYDLFSSYNASNGFFDQFEFEVVDDPTHGYVDYVDYNVAIEYGLVNYTDKGQIYIGVDHNDVVSSNARGRKSVRLKSKEVINGNTLLVLNVDHMPSTTGNSMAKGCSIWPAFWTFGSDWPYNGEIDIIEYVNDDSVVASTLHTDFGCDQSGEDTDSFTGSWGLSSISGQPSTNCDVNAVGQDTNAGCGIQGTEGVEPVGAAFNSGTGGVYVTEWDSSKEIRMFYFPRDSIPSDLQSGSPNPDGWGNPYARFEVSPDSSSCPSSHFQDHNIIFDTTFCGDWAGNTFPYSCSSSISCVDFVKNNPAEFAESYWLVNSVDIYSAC
mgnify:CR=1 FL=1